MQIRKVFLSSTARDLREYREAAYHAIEGLDGYHCVRMEDFGARDREADEFCAAKVSECELFVGIVGHLYGSCPTGSETSYTEMEYNTAADTRIPRLIFVAPEDFPINAKLIESDDKRDKQKSFRERVNKDGIHTDFGSPDNLAMKVTQAIQNKITNTRKEGTSVHLQRSPRPRLFAGREEELEALIPNQIPQPPIDFMGREEEISDILSNFDKGGTIVSLRGMAGVGKTALAFALAERLKDRFPDGQLFVSMLGTSPKPLTSQEAMVQVIRSYAPTHSLPESEAEQANLYRSVLDGKIALLLLDNVLDEGQVMPLFPLRKCCLIFTILRKFILPGMTAKDLDVLKLDKAAELLQSTSGTDSKGNQSQEEAWKELARLCGCLPVALRAAGSFLANTPGSSPKQYIRELQDERKRLEIMGKEGVEEDVVTKFSLSYSRLSPETAKVFRLLSIFPGDFDARAEEAICQDEGHRHLNELVRWSLAEYRRIGDEEEGRYHLHDLVKLFAAERLEGDGDEDARNDAHQRHAKFFQYVLSSATEDYNHGGDGVGVGLRKFDLERMNIEAGWAWAKKNIIYNDASASLCSAYLNSPHLFELRISPKEIISRIETALAGARKIRDKRMEAVHLGNLGNAYAALGDAHNAIEYHEQALAISRKIGDRRGEGADLANLGKAYAVMGDGRKAIEYYEQALTIASKINDRNAKGGALDNLGSAYAALGEPRKAIEYLERALAIAQEIKYWLGQGIALCNLGKAYADLGEIRKAIEYYEQSLEIASKIEYRRGEADAIFNMSLALDKLGQRPEAIDHAKAALVIFEQIESPDAEKAREKLAEWQG